MNKHNLENALQEAIRIKEGDIEAPKVTEIVPSELAVYEIRKKLHLTQSEFAEKYGFKIGTIRNWEQGIRTPDQPAQTLLKLIERQPELISDLIKDASERTGVAL